MSAFSDVLNRFKEEKNIKIQPLARYCEIERSTIYKFINGKRLPGNISVVKKIAQFMQLTPSETHTLTNAWKVSHIGSEAYFSQKSVEDFICQFPDKPTDPMPALDSSISLPEIPSDNTFVVLSSQQYVNNCVRQMILNETGKTSGKIGLFLQPDYSFLFQLLASLNPSGTLQIDHIFSLPGHIAFNSHHQLYNLEYLKEIFPIYANGLDYNTLYFYNSTKASVYSPSIMPCLILTSDAAVMCTADHQNGLYYQDKKTLQMLWRIFEKNKEQCQPLFKPILISPENYLSVFHSIDDAKDDSNKKIIGIQPEACLTPFITGALLRDAFNQELPQANIMIPMIEEIFLKNRERVKNGNFLIYFTEAGIKHFAKTGLIEEFPDSFYHPLTPEQRLILLEEIKSCCQHDYYRLLKGPLQYLPANLHLCVRDTDCELTYNTSNGKNIFLIICESQFFQIFKDYLEQMEETNYYPPEDACALIQNVINTLKESDQNESPQLTV